MRPLYQRRRWAARALTLYRNAQALSDDMLAALGPEHPATDHADDAAAAAGSLAAVLEKDTLEIWKPRP